MSDLHIGHIKRDCAQLPGLSYNGIGSNIDDLGISIYTVSARNTSTNTNVNLTATAQVIFNAYACVDNLVGVPVPNGSQTFLDFLVSNNSGFARRLISVSLTAWPNGHKFELLKLSSATLWTGSIINPPLQIGLGGLAWDATGTDAARTLGNGAVNQTLRFGFSKSVGGSGTFALTTTWDDGTGARTCTKSISVTP